MKLFTKYALFSFYFLSIVMHFSSITCMKRPHDDVEIMHEHSVQKKQCLEDRHNTEIPRLFPDFPSEIEFQIIACSAASTKNTLRSVNKWLSENVVKSNITLIMQKSLVISKSDQAYLLRYHADNKDDDPAIIKALLDNGFDPYVKDKILYATPYLIALKTSNYTIADCLHKYDSSKFTRRGRCSNHREISRLTIAIYKGDLNKMTEILESQTIAIDSVQNDTRNKMSALCIAAYLGHAHIVEFILKRSDWDYKNSPLAPHYAAQAGHINILEILLPYFENFNKKEGSLTLTPLHYAGSNNHTKVISYLLENGANIEAENTLNQTPLFAAAEYECVEAMQLLIESGANIKHILPDTEKNIVHSIIDKRTNSNPIQIIELCINKGIDVNAQDKLGNTALFYAVKNDRTEIIELLLARGADDTITNKLDNTSSSIKKNKGTDFDVKTGRFDSTPLHDASEKNDIEAISYLLENGADIEAENKLGQTALFTAAANKCSKAIYHLILKANIKHILPDTKKNIIHCILDNCINLNPFQIIEYCICKGINVNAQDNLGNTPLHYAVKNNLIDIARLLLKRGADKNIRNSDKETPLDIATADGDAKMIQLLTNHNS